MEWVVTASELQVEERFVFDRSLDRAAMDALDEDDQGFGRVCTTCFCFSHELLFLIMGQATTTIGLTPSFTDSLDRYP